METVFDRFLEPNEQLLWTGHTQHTSAFDKTSRSVLLLKFVICYGIAIAFMLHAYAGNHALPLSSYLMILAFGSIIPLAGLADCWMANRLKYAATNQRLMKLNGSSLVSAPYEKISSCAFHEDNDAHVNLLCGEKTVGTRPSSWRGLATLNVSEPDEAGNVQDFVFYALEDPEGLKKVLDGKVEYRS